MSDKNVQKFVIWGIIIFCVLSLGKSIVNFFTPSELSENKEELSVCECEAAYRSLMYGEGSHKENHYTGEVYSTIDANGNSYYDLIKACDRKYGGVALNDGGFSSKPEYQDCIKAKNEPIGNNYPDTLIVKWDLQNSHLYKLDKIGGYLYEQAWNPHGFVVMYSGKNEDSYGNTVTKNVVEGRYKVSKRFQLEAKKFAGADFYRWKTGAKEEPGMFGTFIKCVSNHDFNQSQFCDCSYLMAD